MELTCVESNDKYHFIENNIIFIPISREICDAL